MINNFVRQTIELLKRSDIIVRPTEIRPVEFNYEENINSKTIHLSVHDYFGGADLANNFILQIMIMFSILDAYVDLKHPLLQGKSYRKKYKALPQNTDDEIILKEVFRLFKVLRNASVHSMSSISLANDSVVVSFQHLETNYSLEITKKGVNLLFTYVLDVLRPIKELTPYHLEGLNRKIYDQIINEINTFTDDFGTGLQNISNELRLKRIVRYYVKNPKYLIQNNKIQITSIYELESIVKDYYGVDYFIEINFDKYLIPEEVLMDYRVPVNELERWVLK